jgi:hypothetical protein
MVILQGLLFGELKFDQTFLQNLYQSEVERYNDLYIRSIGGFSSINLRTALQETAIFVSQNFPNISLR